VSSLGEDFVNQLFDENGPPPAVDWERYRLMQLIPGTAGSDPHTRDQLIARGFVEIAKGKFDADTERRSLVSLRVLVEQIIGQKVRVVQGFLNPMVDALRGGPAQGAPPNVARLLSAVSDIVAHAQEVTIAAESDVLGERLMTLLFVDGKYVGFLPAQRVVQPSTAKS
jgi:hypothetical protein